MFVDHTRTWLRKNHHKGLVYIPSGQFMEITKVRYNPPEGPPGLSIGCVELNYNEEDSDLHAVICQDGKVYYDNDKDRHNEYSHILGYFLVYDLGKDKDASCSTCGRLRQSKKEL